jgi:hypothetical protein
MPVFCAEFAWCSPEAFRALTLSDYRKLREHLVKRAEGMKKR